MPTGHPITKEQIQFIIDNYSDMTNYELAETVGVARSCICRVQMKYGLKKSKEHYHLMGVKAGKASNSARGGKWLGMCQDVIDRRAATYVKTLRAEQARYKWGLPQQTKIRLEKEPRHKREQRIRRIRMGYIIDEPNLIAYYTPDTQRSKRLENIPRGQIKGKYKSYYEFKPYDEK